MERFRETRWRINSQLSLNLLCSICVNLPPKLNILFKFTLHYRAKLFRSVVNIVQFLQLWFRIAICQIFVPGSIKCICSSLLLSRILVISYYSDAAMRLFASVFIVKIIWMRLVGGTVDVASWRRDPTRGRLFEFSWIVRCLRCCMEGLTTQADKGGGLCVTFLIRIFQVWRDEKFLWELKLAFLSTESIS